MLPFKGVLCGAPVPAVVGGGWGKKLASRNTPDSILTHQHASIIHQTIHNSNISVRCRHNFQFHACGHRANCQAVSIMNQILYVYKILVVELVSTLPVALASFISLSSSSLLDVFLFSSTGYLCSHARAEKYIYIVKWVCQNTTLQPHKNSTVTFDPKFPSRQCSTPPKNKRDSKTTIHHT